MAQNRIINAVRGWVASALRNPRDGGTLPAPPAITVELVQERVKHHAPRMNMWGHHIRWVDWVPDDKGLRHFYGHMPRGSIKVGDWFAQDLTSNKVGILEIVSMDWQGDPIDMFFGTAMDVGFLPEGIVASELCLPPIPSPSDPRMTRFVSLRG